MTAATKTAWPAASAGAGSSAPLACWVANLVAVQLATQWAGLGYPAQPTFGITPCPLTLFTFGVLLLTRSPVPRSLLIIPQGWSLLGGSAAFLLGVPQDWPLLFSGMAVLLLVLRERRRS